MAAAVVYGCLMRVKGRLDFISSWYKCRKTAGVCCAGAVLFALSFFQHQHGSILKNTKRVIVIKSRKSFKSQRCSFGFFQPQFQERSPVEGSLQGQCSVSIDLKKDSVEESLTGLFPAAGGAPLVSVLNAVHLSAFLGFAPNPPVSMK